jgi:hypothetical protein
MASRIVAPAWSGKPASICLALWFAVGLSAPQVAAPTQVILANSSKNWRRRSCGIAFIGLSAGAKRVIRSLTCLDTKRCPLSVQQAPIA